MKSISSYLRGRWGILSAAMVMAALCYAMPASSGHGGEERDPGPMVVIPAGLFMMGSIEGTGRQDERPNRRIYLSSFAIDTYEVTNARYFTFVNATGHRHPPDPYAEDIEELLTSSQGIEDLPVVQVNWYDASEYCQWAGKRLPTEAEWEKAARGSDGRIYPWGNDDPTPQHANFDRDWDSKGTLHPVGSLPGGDSPYGVADMAGNAREWIQDWYEPDYYKRAPSRNPKGPESGVLRVIRGGSWHSPLADIRNAARGKGGFALKTHGIGFRCAKDVAGQSPNARIR